MEERKIKDILNVLKPENFVFVISVDENNKPNIMVAGWQMRCSYDPPLFAISLSKKGYTNKLIHKKKEFVIALPNKKLEKYVEFFGSNHGDKIDKFKESKLETIPAKFVKYTNVPPAKAPLVELAVKGSPLPLSDCAPVIPVLLFVVICPLQKTLFPILV